MDWFIQHEHEHCPYCRKEMLQPNDLKEAARHLLGEQRVVELGMWQGEQIVPADWVQAAVTPDAPHLEPGAIVISMESTTSRASSSESAT